MRATMMHFPMSVPMIFRHGLRHHVDAQICHFDGENVLPQNYGEVGESALKLASLLKSAGVKPGDRVATFCWNHPQHLAAYFAVPMIGAILHTLNIRLFPEQLLYIMNDAEDSVLIVDETLLPQIGEILPEVESLKEVLVIGSADDADLSDAFCIRDFDSNVADSEPFAGDVAISETSAAAVCYTSGTTGNPKGVVYSHKTIFMHSMASLGADTFAISQQDRILLLPPMFHANAWGLPYSGWFAGADIITLGPHLQPEPMRRLIEETRPTFTAMVPTLVNDLLRAHDEDPIDMSSFRVIVSGGSAVAPVLIERVRDYWEVPVVQGWGMTETSPLCALSVPPRDLDTEQETLLRAKSGRPVPGVEVRAVDEAGGEVPSDGHTVGKLQLRGPWIANGYHDLESSSPLTADGWLDTGDAGTIDARGYVQVTDRLKDLIKSGGEWIPSAELENHIAGLPDIDLAGVIGVADERWEERPLAIVTTVNDARPDFARLRVALRDRVARFWIPEYWAHTDTLPLTSVGKIDKQSLREAVVTGKMDFERVDEVS